MADITEVISVVGSSAGFHTVTVTLKSQGVTSKYSYKATQSAIPDMTKVCRTQALKNLMAATQPEEVTDGVVPKLRAVPTIGSPDS